MSDTGGSKNPMPRPGVTDHENAAKHMHIECWNVVPGCTFTASASTEEG
jgi:hypothetical protein